MAKSYRTIKNHYGTKTPKIKQVFCRHKYELGREFNPNGVQYGFCVYEKCSKCGFFKTIQYYEE